MQHVCAAFEWDCVDLFHRTRALECALLLGSSTECLRPYPPSDALQLNLQICSYGTLRVLPSSSRTLCT